MLDERLSLVYDLYDKCALAADIGTDHAHLPAALLQRGRCRKMILTDRSENALDNARAEISRRRLTDLVSFRLGDGLAPLEETCGMISITGMGGRTIRTILTEGRERLKNASLILSAHTDWPLIRQSLAEIGYHAEKEEPCYAAGRFYLVIRARPGAEALNDQQIRLGIRLFDSTSPWLLPFLARRREVLERQLAGLETATEAHPELQEQLREDIAYYTEKMEG